MNKTIIQPSHDFAERTMMHIARIEKRRRLSRALVITSASLGPSVTREMWMFVRGDYISASSLPMGHFITQAYGLFISPVAGYALVAAALIPTGFAVSRYGTELRLLLGDLHILKR